MDHPRPKPDLAHRAQAARDEHPDILAAEVHQMEHEAAEEAVKWLEERARKVQEVITPPARRDR